MRTRILGLLAIAALAFAASSAPAAAFQWQNKSHAYRSHSGGLPKVYSGHGFAYGAYKIKKKHSDNWFDRADSNNDGALSYREYNKTIKKQWKARSYSQGHAYGKHYRPLPRHAKRHAFRHHNHGYTHRPHYKARKLHRKHSRRRPVVIFKF